MKKIIILIGLFITTIGFSQQIGDGLAAPYQTDFTALLKSGVYGGPDAIGKVPDISNEWNHLFVIRHANPSNNHQLQIASTFTENDRLFFRKIAIFGLTSKNPSWIEIATRGTNSFTGDQFVAGTIRNFEATSLGTSAGSYQLLNEKGGSVGENKFYNRSWLLRDLASGSDWYSARIHDGISIDVSFNTPKVNTKTWWERDPLDNIQSWGNGAETYLTIDKGNVGIGTIAPTNKLDVNGIIHSKEVKVDLTGWSDFVFKKEYNLPTLEEVEKHIAQKGHLENIPSEEEVLKNGIALGEMNAKLLQKIEELTLYVIEQNKEMALLKAQMKAVLGKKINFVAMKYYLTSFLFAFCLLSHAQTKLNFSYDNAGNQISRVLCINCTSKPAAAVKEIEAITTDDLEKFSEEDVISYYPNPVKEELYLQWELIEGNYVTAVQVFSMTGQMLRTYTGNATTQNLTIPFQSYPSGVYLVLLSYKVGEAKSIKIIKQ